jgi:hypothetical protein
LSDQQVRIYFEKVMEFYNDLIQSKLLEIDYFTFDCSTLETLQDEQARSEIVEKRQKIQDGVESHTYFLLMNEIYSTAYEKFCDTCLRLISEKIKKTKITKKGKMIEAVKDYKGGYFFPLIENFKPKVRNSISHEDFYIDNKQQKIMFYDEEGANYLNLTKKEYEMMFEDIFFVLLAFDRAKWELMRELEYDLISRIETVNDYCQKKGLTMKPSATSKMSIVVWSDLIRGKKI